MPLQNRLTALAQAIGADVKALRTDRMTIAAMLALSPAANQYRIVLATDLGPSGTLWQSRQVGGNWRWCPYSGTALIYVQPTINSKNDADNLVGANQFSLTVPAGLIHELGELRILGKYRSTNQAGKIRLAVNGSAVTDSTVNARSIDIAWAYQSVNALTNPLSMSFGTATLAAASNFAVSNTIEPAASSVDWSIANTFAGTTYFGLTGTGSNNCGIVGVRAFITG